MLQGVGVGLGDGDGLGDTVGCGDGDGRGDRVGRGRGECEGDGREDAPEPVVGSDVPGGVRPLGGSVNGGPQ